MKTICGIDCSECFFKESCKGCAATLGRPFGGDCIVAKCCEKKGVSHCSDCSAPCSAKQQILNEINELSIEGLPKITELYQLVGSYINIEYTLPNGQKTKFWEDNKIYFGCQVEINGTDQYYGITANEEYLLVCQYGENGVNPQIILYQKRKLITK